MCIIVAKAKLLIKGSTANRLAKASSEVLVEGTMTLTHFDRHKELVVY